MGVILLLAGLSGAACPTVSLDEVAATEAPAVIVLGERHGHRQELRRAAALVEALGERGPVTVALEAVHGERQQVIDAFGDRPRRCRLKRDLSWKDTWGYRFGTYWPVLKQARHGAALVGAGLDLGPAPDDAAVPVPEGYQDDLAEAMEGHDMPPEMAARFTRSMAWRDLRIAEQAVDGWDGQGVLVILTGRGHVEGGKGVTWQLQDLTEATVVPVLLDGEDATCPAGARALGG